MKLYFFIEARISKVNGTYYLPDMFGEKVLNRYLEVFDSISVVCRVSEAEIINQGGLKPLSNNKINIVDLPLYEGPFDYIKKKKLIKSIISSCIETNSAYLCRVPGQIGSIAAEILKNNGIKYAVEVVGDPWESMSPQAYKHPFAPLLRIIARNNLRKVVKDASSALYVTEYVLQKRYPVSSDVFTTNASNVELTSDNILQYCPDISRYKDIGTYKFMAIGTLAQLYKAPDIVLQALSEAFKAGVKFHFTWYGDGKYRESMIQLAEELGLSEYVSFPGNVSHGEIMTALNNFDMLIHASRAEGLPRAVIEAMAHALPVIGTKVAGIPELLMPDAIVPVNDAHAVFEKIQMFCKDPNKMLQHAIHNLNKAKEFEKTILAERRRKFYHTILELYI